MREITQTDHDTGEEVVVDSMPIPFPYQRMKPLVGSASEGRAKEGANKSPNAKKRLCK